MIQHLERIEHLAASFDQETKDFLDQIEVTKHLKKGDILLHAGDTCQRSFQVCSGIVRKYVLKAGKEITTDFYFEEDIAVAFNSYTFQQPSLEYLDCLTDVTAKVTHRHDWERAKATFPQLMELDLLLTELHAGSLEEDLHDLRLLTATERYQKLMDQTPELLQYIKLTHIASYLNISLETLSRIRAKY